MLKVLFCISCCGAPPSNRAGRQAGKSAQLEQMQSGGAKPEDEKLSLTQEEADFQGLLALAKGEKDQLLANQIQVSNSERDYGSKDTTGRLLSGAMARPTAGGARADDRELLREDSVTASTSAPKYQSAKQGGDGFSKLARQAQDSPQLQAASLDLPAGLALGLDASGRQLIDQTESELNYYEVQSVSPPSSIDVEQYREMPNDVDREQLETEADATTADGLDISETAAAVGSRERSYSAGSLDTSVNIPSTTKIGDYARLEYSPVEDLESVTTMSASRGGSLPSSNRNRRQSGVTRASSSSRHTSPNNKRSSQASGLSRGSSRGIESTSISIASQLSNEQLQQNLTNMLESANSPISMFGTIGLPLGPPLDNAMMTETAKTSPETTGAALTSASQDSLSGGSLGSPKAVRKAATAAADSVQEPGAALVGDSTELEASTQLAGSLASESTMGTLDRTSTIEPPPGERVGSRASMITTTSGGLTNPTPTPSEMSAGSQKKKSRLRPKALLKKLKPGSKKKSKNEDDKGNAN